MEKNVLKINIEKPIDFVFKFTISPENTPKWIPSISEEKTSEPKIKVGTIYRQRLLLGGSAEYVVSEFIENRRFVLKLLNGTYSCSYKYEAAHSGTQLIYSETDKKLDSPMAKKNLLALKKLIEESG